MSIVPRPRHRADSADAGFGLPELLVSMTVFSIVIAAMTAVFVNTIDSVRFVQTKSETIADARIAMEAMTRSIRVAITPKGEGAALVEAESDRLVFYSSLARGGGQDATSPTRVTYEYNSTTRCLEETQVVASLRSPAVPTQPFEWLPASASTKCLIVTNAPPQFVYFDDGRIMDDDATPAVPVVALATPSGVLPAADLGKVVSIEMSLNVQDPNATDVNGTLARDRVTLANVQSALNLGD